MGMVHGLVDNQMGMRRPAGYASLEAGREIDGSKRAENPADVRNHVFHRTSPSMRCRARWYGSVSIYFLPDSIIRTCSASTASTSSTPRMII